MSLDATAGLSAAWSSVRTDFNAQTLRRAAEASAANRLAEASLAMVTEANQRPAAAASEPAPSPAAPPPGQGRMVDRLA